MVRSTNNTRDRSLNEVRPYSGSSPVEAAGVVMEKSTLLYRAGLVTVTLTADEVVAPAKSVAEIEIGDVVLVTWIG